MCVCTSLSLLLAINLNSSDCGRKCQGSPASQLRTAVICGNFESFSILIFLFANPRAKFLCFFIFILQFARRRRRRLAGNGSCKWHASLVACLTANHQPPTTTIAGHIYVSLLLFLYHGNRQCSALYVLLLMLLLLPAKLESDFKCFAVRWQFWHIN